MIESPGRTDDYGESFGNDASTDHAGSGMTHIGALHVDGTPQRSTDDGGVRFDSENRGDPASAAIQAIGAEAILSGLFASLTESVFIKDLDGRVLYGNETFYKRLGCDRSVIGRTMTTVLPSHLHAASIETDRLVMTEGRTVRAEYQCAHDGRDDRWFETEKSPLWKDGSIVGLLGISRDITDRVRDRDRHASLVDDLNHRVRNILASVRALAQQSSDSDVPPEEFYEQIQQRVSALASAHGLVHSHARGTLSFLDLVRSVTRGYVDHSVARLVIRGSDFRLHSDLCTPMALVLNELSTNALQHGAWSNALGTVEVSWSIDDAAGTATMNWRERGGPVPEVPAEPGQGMELLDRLARTQLRGGASMSCTDDGMTAQITFRYA